MILVLGGTGNAHQIAEALQAAKMDFIVSLAGATYAPVERNYQTRIGGFGGADGLCEYIQKTEITAIIDATHPFAETISNSAVEAANAASVPIARFVRPAWVGEGAQIVPDLASAADALPTGARAFLTVGGKSLAPFTHRTDVWFLFRSIDPIDSPFSDGEALIQRPPFSHTSETDLMKARAITHLVTKNAGGWQTSAKIKAATEMGIPVIMVERPVLPVVESASTVSDILRWIETI